MLATLAGRIGPPSSRGMPDRAITTRPVSAGQLALELPVDLPALGIEPDWKAQAAPVGPQPAPDVLVPRELPGGPRPRVHRPLHASRRRGPRPVQRPRHGPPPGGRGGPDRGRQRPQPARPRPDRRQARARDAGRGPHPPRRAPPRMGGRRRRRGSTLADRVRDEPRRRVGVRVPAAGSGDAIRTPATEPVPLEVAAVVPPADARPAPARPRRSSASTTRRTASCRRPGRDPPRQDPGLPVDDHAQHVQHGAALRASGSWSGPATSRRSGTCSTASARSSTGSTVSRCRPPPGSRSTATPGPPARAPAPGAPRPRPPGPCPARRHVAALPARAQVRLLQLAAHVAARVRRRRRSTRSSTTPTSGPRTSRSCARSSPTSARP